MANQLANLQNEAIKVLFQLKKWLEASQPWQSEQEKQKYFQEVKNFKHQLIAVKENYLQILTSHSITQEEQALIGLMQESVNNLLNALNFPANILQQEKVIAQDSEDIFKKNKEETQICLAKAFYNLGACFTDSAHTRTFLRKKDGPPIIKNLHKAISYFRESLRIFDAIPLTVSAEMRKIRSEFRRSLVTTINSLGRKCYKLAELSHGEKDRFKKVELAQKAVDYHQEALENLSLITPDQDDLEIDQADKIIFQRDLAYAFMLVGTYLSPIAGNFCEENKFKEALEYSQKEIDAMQSALATLQSIPEEQQTENDKITSDEYQHEMALSWSCRSNYCKKACLVHDAVQCLKASIKCTLQKRSKELFDFGWFSECYGTLSEFYPANSIEKQLYYVHKTVFDNNSHGNELIQFINFIHTLNNLSNLGTETLCEIVNSLRKTYDVFVEEVNSADFPDNVFKKCFQDDYTKNNFLQEYQRVMAPLEQRIGTLAEFAKNTSSLQLAMVQTLRSVQIENEKLHKELESLRDKYAALQLHGAKSPGMFTQKETATVPPLPAQPSQGETIITSSHP